MAVQILKSSFSIPCTIYSFIYLFPPLGHYPCNAQFEFCSQQFGVWGVILAEYTSLLILEAIWFRHRLPAEFLKAPLLQSANWNLCSLSQLVWLFSKWPIILQQYLMALSFLILRPVRGSLPSFYFLLLSHLYSILYLLLVCSLLFVLWGLW